MDALFAVIALAVPAALFGVVVYRLRRLRLFVWLRVVDGKTGAPLAGAGVFALYADDRKPLGMLDASGDFKVVLGRGDAGALLIDGAGGKGMVGRELVSEYLRFPAAPYVCTVSNGQLLPPARSSPVARGLGPGDEVFRCTGYCSMYERPSLGDVVQCWGTLEDAKRNAPDGEHFWKVEGPHVMDFGGGCQVSAESIEQA